MGSDDDFMRHLPGGRATVLQDLLTMGARGRVGKTAERGWRSAAEDDETEWKPHGPPVAHGNAIPALPGTVSA